MTDFLSLILQGFAAVGLSHCWYIKGRWWMLCYAIMFWLMMFRRMFTMVAETYGYTRLGHDAMHLIPLLISIVGLLGTCFLFKRIRAEEPEHL